MTMQARDTGPLKAVSPTPLYYPLAAPTHKNAPRGTVPHTRATSNSLRGGRESPAVGCSTALDHRLLDAVKDRVCSRLGHSGPELGHARMGLVKRPAKRPEGSVGARACCKQGVHDAAGPCQFETLGADVEQAALNTKLEQHPHDRGVTRPARIVERLVRRSCALERLHNLDAAPRAGASALERLGGRQRAVFGEQRAYDASVALVDRLLEQLADRCRMRTEKHLHDLIMAPVDRLLERLAGRCSARDEHRLH
eukprot:scaffold47735_cov57-Phaeocystis_antarctica.AAC.1